MDRRFPGCDHQRRCGQKNAHGYDWITRYRAYHRGQNRSPSEERLFPPHPALAIPETQDNAPMESFFGTLKTELVHQSEYPDRDTVRIPGEVARESAMMSPTIPI